MSLWKKYHLVHSIREAFQVLSESNGRGRLIAGGTDLLLDLDQGRYPEVDTLVDISSIPELSIIEECQDRLFIGAAAPLSRIIASNLVRKHAEALKEACELIGGSQVRNVATLGGNVAHALPAADGTIALLALDAKAVVVSLDGERVLELEELFYGPGKSTIDPIKELILGFSLSLIEPRQASIFLRVMRPQGVALPILNLAVWLLRENDHHNGGIIGDIRIAVGPSGPTPKRARQCEEVLRGNPLNQDSLDKALSALLEESHFRNSPHRTSIAYRKHLSEVLFIQGMNLCWHRTF
jgi:CO/xanthine dehydrogenase FAD-binding subunit